MADDPLQRVPQDDDEVVAARAQGRRRRPRPRPAAERARHRVEGPKRAQEGHLCARPPQNTERKGGQKLFLHIGCHGAKNWVRYLEVPGDDRGAAHLSLKDRKLRGVCREADLSSIELLRVQKNNLVRQLNTDRTNHKEWTCSGLIEHFRPPKMLSVLLFLLLLSELEHKIGGVL